MCIMFIKEVKKSLHMLFVGVKKVHNTNIIWVIQNKKDIDCAPGQQKMLGFAEILKSDYVMWKSHCQYFWRESWILTCQM